MIKCKKTTDQIQRVRNNNGTLIKVKNSNISIKGNIQQWCVRIIVLHKKNRIIDPINRELSQTDLRDRSGIK